MAKKVRAYKDSIRVVNLASYDTPVIKEEHNKDWVSFGHNNDYFDRLIDRYLDSPTNSRCINGIIDMVYGRGLESTNSEIFPSHYVKMRKLLRPKEIKRLINDYYLLGQGALQISYSKDKKTILKVSHYPMETLRAEKASNGVIKAYYYHPKWADLRTSDEPKRIPTFGNGSDKQLNEIYIFKPYRSGFYYYATTAYQACLQYAKLESEVSNYHISNIENGLAPSLFINFNNGIPDETIQTAIENKINHKFSGSSSSGKAIIAFNESAETKADIEPIHLPDAHAQYQFLSDEATAKIMLGHGIVSPILLGIKDNTGFGNNAEELRTASVLMDNVIIRPLQDGVLYGLEEILEFNSIHQNLYFKTLQPIEFTELDNVSTKVKREEETGEKLSAIELDDFEDEEGDDIVNQLEGLGEVLSDDWEVIHSEIYQEGKEELKMADLASDKKENWFKQLLAYANPKKKSSEDSDIYKIRYAYMPERKSADSRNFCKSMENLTSKKLVFRKEDINMMSFRGVNKVLGHKKRRYSLLKFKGGKNCHHYWELRVYRKNGTTINPNEAYEKGLKQPNNPKELEERMIDRADKGAY
jgi:hypothetical protein